MQEKRGILGGEKNNMVKSQPKKEVNNLDLLDLAYIYRTKYKTSNKYRTTTTKRYILAISKKRRINFLKELSKLLNKYSK